MNDTWYPKGCVADAAAATEHHALEEASLADAFSPAVLRVTRRAEFSERKNWARKA